MPTPVGVEPVAMRAAAIILLAIAMWATNVLPSYYTSLLFMFAAVVMFVAPAKVAFSGFHSAAMWLVFGGLIVGQGVKKVGLDVRLVQAFLSHTPKSFAAILYGVFWASAALAFVVPSASGRVVMLMPIILTMAERMGFAGNSKGRTGLILAATMGTVTPSFAVLPANVPNLTLYGAIESIYGVQLTFSDYFALNFPVIGLAALLFYPAIIFMLFRDLPRYSDKTETSPNWTADEIRLLLILVIALALWASDAWHDISPAWVAMGAGLLCVMPGIGILPTRTLADDFNYGPMLFIAGVIGLGAVANESGLGALIAAQLLSVIDLQPGADFKNFASITGLNVITGIITTLPAQAAIIIPISQAVADATGWSLISVLMIPVASWTIFPLPYQAPPLVLALAMTNIRIGWVIRLLLTYFVFGALFILPLHFLWGRHLGYFGG